MNFIIMLAVSIASHVVLVNQDCKDGVRISITPCSATEKKCAERWTPIRCEEKGIWIYFF